MADLPIGKIVDMMHAVREEIRALNNKIKELEELTDTYEKQLMDRLDKDQVEMVRGSLASASITETVVAQIEDFDKFGQWVLRNKALYMLERRVSNGAYRDELNSRPKGIPGLKPFTKRKISLRAI